MFFRIFSIISWHFHRKQNQSDPNQPSLISIAVKLSYNYYIGYVIMKHAKEKGATAQQTFPFLACFNEQIFLRSRKKSSARADLRVCLVQKKRERLRSRHFLFLHVSTSKYFCAAEKKALQERICSCRARSIFRQKSMYSKNLLIEKFRNGF